MISKQTCFASNQRTSTASHRTSSKTDISKITNEQKTRNISCAALILVAEIVNDPQQMRRNIYYTFLEGMHDSKLVKRCHRSKRKMRSKIDGFLNSNFPCIQPILFQ